jgi:hypothetical protein
MKKKKRKKKQNREILISHIYLVLNISCFILVFSPQKNPKKPFVYADFFQDPPSSKVTCPSAKVTCP